MKKSTKVKSKKVSKPSASPRKRLKKYEEGGKEVQGLKRNNNFDSMPGSNMPLAPKGDAMTMDLKSEAVPSNKQLKKIELPAGSPDFSGQGAYAVTPAKMDEKKVETVSTPKAKKIAGGFSSEAQKAAYIKNAKDMIAKGKTVDDLVKSRFGTKEGLAALGIKDNVKPKTPAKSKSGTKTQLKVERKNGTTTMTRTTKRTTVVPKNTIASSVARQGVTEKLPLSSKVPLKNGKMTSEDKKRLGKQQASYGKHLKEIYIRKQNDLDRKKALKQLKENFEETRIRPTDLIPGFRMVKQGQKIIKAAKVADKILPTAKKFLGSSSGKKLIGEGIKSVVKTGSKALKPDKIFKPITKAIPRSTNAGKTIKVNGRTVSEGSQKLLGNGQKMLGNTKGLPAPKKGLPVPKSSSNLKAGSAVKARENRIISRNNKSAKIESSIKTNNPVSRSMVRTRKTNELVKQGKQKIVKGAKSMKNSKPKPGDQLKLNLRKGGKVSTMRRGGKK